MAVLPIGDPPNRVPISEGAGTLTFVWSSFFLALQLFANRILLFLYAGTPGQVLTANGVGVNPSFQALPTPATAPGCYVTNSVAQSIPNNAFTALTFDSEIFNVGPLHSTSVNSSRITIPAGQAGRYLFGASSLIAASAVGQRIVQFLINGTTEIGGDIVGNPGATFTESLLATALLVLAVGDYVEVRVYQNSGGALDAGAAIDYLRSAFWATKVA